MIKFVVILSSLLLLTACQEEDLNFTTSQSNQQLINRGNVIVSPVVDEYIMTHIGTQTLF